MNIYHVWCDLKPGVSDLTFTEKVNAYLGHLKAESLIESFPQYDNLNRLKTSSVNSSGAADNSVRSIR